MNYLKNVLDSIYNSIAPSNIPPKVEMNILVRFEVMQISSFSERQLISRKFKAEVYGECNKISCSYSFPDFVYLILKLFDLK